MEKRKDCFTCFNNHRKLNEEPCVSCVTFNKWVSQDTFKEGELVFSTNGNEHRFVFPPMASEDPVNNPAHYTKGIQPIEAIESWKLGYNLGNVIKYVARADHKGKRIEDLKKARWYLDREINNNESNV